MSLDAIRRARLAGRKPRIVQVVVGPHQPVVDDDHGVVLIEDGMDPEKLDWRPLIGVALVLLQPEARPELAQRVVQAAFDAGADFIASADPRGEILLGDQPEELKPLVRKARELLCLS